MEMSSPEAEPETARDGQPTTSAGRVEGEPVDAYIGVVLETLTTRDTTFPRDGRKPVRVEATWASLSVDGIVGLRAGTAAATRCSGPDIVTAFRHGVSIAIRRRRQSGIREPRPGDSARPQACRRARAPDL
jgi:hypothetical protein